MEVGDLIAYLRQLFCSSFVGGTRLFYKKPLSKQPSARPAKI